ncbi:MAG TPA: dihydrolipoyl dehydrogenase [Clostridiaceae bacterium]|nr:dihydrolipoyl dehydrogenase [Clostridiaceae bacterium]
MSDFDYDIVIIGGGPGGYPAAIYAKRKGLKVALIEKNIIGGTCLNVGCIPTKSLLQSANLYKEFANSDLFGISAENVSFDWAKVVGRKDEVVQGLTSGVSMLLGFHGVDVYSGYGMIVDKNTVKVKSEEETLLTTEYIIIATGSKPTVVPVPGHSLEGVITSNEALSLDKLPKSLVVVGGGVIGVELAYVFNAFGVEVTIIEMLPNILMGQDEDAAGIVKSSLQSKGVDIFTSAKLTSIEKAASGLEVNFETDSEQHNLIADQVLMATGRKPNLEIVEESSLDFNCEKTGIVVDEYLRTNIPNIYAIGDVTGKIMLAHVATHQALTAVNNILGNTEKMTYDIVPSCIYLHPELASVGLTEKEAIKSKGEVLVGKFNFGGNGKAKILNQSEGFVKIICDKKYQEILGVHIVGPTATELIAEAVLAMELECTAEELAKAIHAHPTLSESVMESAQNLMGYSIHGV